MPVAVNGLEEARAALRAGARGLISPPFAAGHAGVGYYAALLETLQAEFGDFTFTVCCGDDPAIAHDALRLGFESIICATTPAMLAKLRAIATPMGATVLPHYPLDAEHGAATPARKRK